MRHSTFEEELARAGELVYTNVGTSMLPLLRQNRDLMIIRSKEPGRCRKYDAVLYKRHSGQYVLHRILKVRDKDYVICGDHCYRREYGITEEQIFGVLRGVERDGRQWSVTDWKYRIYVHLWCDFFPIRAMILWTKEKLRHMRRRVKAGICGKDRGSDAAKE